MSMGLSRHTKKACVTKFRALYSHTFADDILPGGTPSKPRDEDFPEPLRHSWRGGNFCDEPHNAWDCDFGHWIEQHPEGPSNEAIYPRAFFDGPLEWTKPRFMNDFHPRSIGYDAIAAEIVRQWERWASEGSSSLSQSVATRNITEVLRI